MAVVCLIIILQSEDWFGHDGADLLKEFHHQHEETETGKQDETTDDRKRGDDLGWKPFQKVSKKGSPLTGFQARFAENACF